MGSALTSRVRAVRLLALVPAEMQRRIRGHLASLLVTVDFAERPADFSRCLVGNTSYQVVLLPAALPEGGWWSLWGEIALLDPRPEIVVYAPSASFTLWSGVLEMGGYDVIVEPFTEKELQRAVVHAARSFAEGHRNPLDEE